MSLDVYLVLPGTSRQRTGSGIFIRGDGQTREISREEWDERFPGREPIIFIRDEETDQVYSANITHNLGKMASEAGLYEPLWRPDEIGVATAGQLIEPLRAGLARLRGSPEEFRMFNPQNGWGTYESLVYFVSGYLAACESHPSAEVRVWR